MSEFTERLRRIAEVKGNADLRAGRKEPIWGPKSEIECRAADLIDEMEELMRGLLKLHEAVLAKLEALK